MLLAMKFLRAILSVFLSVSLALPPAFSWDQLAPSSEIARIHAVSEVVAKSEPLGEEKPPDRHAQARSVINREASMMTLVEPQLTQKNPYGAALRRLLLNSAVTQESIRRREALKEIGLAVERFLQTRYGNSNIKIAIAPYGSTLKGYANTQSDLDCLIHIMAGLEHDQLAPQEHADLIEDLKKEVNWLLKESGISASPSLFFIGNRLDAIYAERIFLPIVYGDASLVEQRRKDRIVDCVSKGQEGEKIWKRIQLDYAYFMTINDHQGAFDDESVFFKDHFFKPHLRDWLKSQNVTSVKDIERFNRSRAVGLPSVV
jgi:predicted nucleotidyltransferase